MAQRVSFLTRLRAAMHTFRVGFEPKATLVAWPYGGGDDNEVQYHMNDYESFVTEGFNSNSILYAALMYKGRSMAKVSFRAATGDADEPQLLPEEHELNKLLKRPNSGQSQKHFMMHQEVVLNIDGNAYSYMQRDSLDDQYPSAIWSLRPDRVYLVPQTMENGIVRTLKGYLYIPQGKSKADAIPILPDEMIHVRMPNPGDELQGQGYGLSCFAALAKPGDVDNRVTDFLNVFYHNGAVVQGVLQFEQSMTQEQVAKARSRWQEIYGGVDNWASVAVLDNKGKYNRVALTFNEMGFEAADERNEVRMLGPLGVPLTLIPTRSGRSASTFNNKITDRKMFWEDVMMSEVDLHVDEMNEYIKDEGVFIHADYGNVPALKVDIEKRAAAWGVLVKYGVPGNLAAATVGLDLPFYEMGEESLRPTQQVLDSEDDSEGDNEDQASIPVNPENWIEQVGLMGAWGQMRERMQGIEK